jgi:hypothetical protein
MKDESNRIETQRSSNLYVQMMDASWKEGINQSVSIAWIIDHCRLSLVATTGTGMRNETARRRNC